MLNNLSKDGNHTDKTSLHTGSVSAIQPLFFQPKLSINQPNDVYEQEADAVADKVMRMPDPSINNSSFFRPAITSMQRKCAHCEEEEKKMHRKEAVTYIQRQDEAPAGTTAPATTQDFTLQVPSLLQPIAGLDYLSMRQPFINRNIFHLWDPNSALQVWQYNFDFFKRLGVSPGLSTTLANLTTPRFIDSQLKANNPTWWEVTDRELNTSTLSLSLLVLQFNADFSPVAPTWWQSIFGEGTRVQRTCAHCEEEEKKMQRKEGNDIETTATPETEHYINSLSGGKPLAEKERSFFEPRMGYDFGDVKIHTDTASVKSAQSVNALAYTTGNNIVFNEGQFNPETDSGKRLLGHELVHVMQQSHDDNNLRKKEKEKETKAVKIQWQGTVAASLYYFIRPVCKNEEEARQIVSNLLLNNSFVYLLNNGNDVSLKDFELVENFEKTKTINIYEGALQIIIDATGHKTKDEFFKTLEANKAVDQKVSQLIKDLKAEGLDIPYENSWLDNFIKGLGQSALSSKLSEAYNKIKDNATSWENGPAFYTGINVGFPAGVAEDLWENIKGIFLLAWQLIKAQFEITTDPLGFYNKMKEELTNLWNVINADPAQLGLLAGNALSDKVDKDFVKVKPFNQGFALGEIVGKIATEIALLFVGVEEVSALAKAAEGTKIGELIIKGIKESETIGKVGELLKGKKGAEVAEEASKGLTDAQKLEETIKLAQKAGDESRPSQELIKLEQGMLEEKIKDPANIKLSGDDNLPEIEVGDHTYKRNAKDQWCRFSTENCDIALSPAVKEAMDKAAAKKTIVVFDDVMKNELINFWTQQKKLTTDSSKIKLYNRYIEKIKKGERPSWSQSEKEMEMFYAQIGGTKQNAYIHGHSTGMNTAGHVRPDLTISTTAVEVKNYKIENKNGLISKLTEQIKKRASMEGLPYDIRQQAIIIDLRGQTIASSEVIDLTIEIQKKTGVPFENIQVLQW
ncbi:DUF4157 domain-containing protein [Parafilimonas sp.]|uniref:eCIS core domain-containing protein n=1 Tax=Parafilimonas sp. TaxID=1969739 RepID=UPI0039E5115A